MEEDAAANRPFIAALAISNARGGLPTPGFFDCARRLGWFADRQDARTFHDADLIAVFAATAGTQGESSCFASERLLAPRRLAGRFGAWQLDG